MKSSQAVRPLRTGGMLFALLVGAACASSSGAAPTVGDSTGARPDLRGHRVMVYPVQRMIGLTDDADAQADQELRFVLSNRSDEVDWIFPEQLRQATESNPMIRANPDRLAVSIFEQAEVNRVGDPLYGQIRLLSELVEGEVALVPVRLRYTAVDTVGSLGAELSTAMIDVRTGRVLWYGVVGGRPGPADDFGTVASAVEALADQVMWFTR